jgi:MtrB/PioB family decaheme-associated outer membrane protein
MPVNRHITLLLTAALLPVVRAQAEEPEVDTSKWPCKFCEFEEGFSFTPDLGVGYVSEDSAKFGEYNGLDEQGAYVVADAEARYRKQDGRWLDLSAMDLGLDSRFFGVEGGKQGQFELHLRYKELQHNLNDTAMSPFLGAGSSSLTLPPGWATGATTGDMSGLAVSLQGLELETGRQIFDLGGSYTPVTHWAFAINVRHEEKEGARGMGGSFMFNDSQLPMPVHYETDQFDASAAYSAGRLQARIAYYGSIFRNEDDAFTWANPYIPLDAGADLGQFALAPDNQFHQLVLSAGYRLAERTQMSANVAYGQMTQDEAFLPFTVNGSVPTQPLPRSSLDGKVDTLSGNLKITTALAETFRVNASLSYNERNNQTPQDLYEWITTDAGPAAPRANLPYSFSRSVASIDAALALTPSLRIYAGCNYDEYRRDLQEVESTNEGACWGKANLSAGDVANLSFMWTYSQRTGSAYQPSPDGTPAQNPLMRLYNLADRDRNEAKLRVDATPAATFNFGLDIRATWDDYFSSTVGVLDGDSWSAAADCGWTISEKISASCYVSHELVKSRQANAELLAPTPLWFGSNHDETDSIGAGFKYGASEKFDLGVDYNYARTTGEVAIQSATVGFPDLTTRMNSARLYVHYAPRKKLTLRLSYWYESYRSEDWALDEVLPATIDNVLSFGQQSPDYDVNVVTLSGRYEF